MKAHTVENPNYAFLDLTIAPTAKPGTINIVGKRGSQTLTQPFALNARDRAPKGLGVIGRRLYLPGHARPVCQW